jgi:hypothetical protein
MTITTLQYRVNNRPHFLSGSFWPFSHYGSPSPSSNIPSVLISTRYEWRPTRQQRRLMNFRAFCAELDRTAPHSACQRPPDRGRRWTKGGVLYGYPRESLSFAHYARKGKRNGASDGNHRYPYTMLPRLSPHSTGTVFPTMLAASPYFCRASRVRSSPPSLSVSPARSWRSSSGIVTQLYLSRNGPLEGKYRRYADC